MMKNATCMILAVILAGCGPGDQVVETKAAEVHPAMSQAQQDQIASSFKTWKPDKKK